MTTAAVRHLSPAARPTGSALSLLGAQVRAEVRQNLRVPDFMIGVVGVPVILFVMFGLPNANQVLPAGTDVGAVMFASLACYGVVSLTIFAFGVDVAQERGKGWLRRLQATPMPMWAYFAGKCVMAVVYAALILVAMLAVAVVAGIPFDAGRLARTVVVLLAGALAFSTMGFALAFWARPRAATAIGNLMFLPLAFASGFFFPIGSLPRLLQDLAPWLPTYHYGQLVWSQAATAGDLLEFGGIAPGSLAGNAAWVAGSFVLFGLLAAAGYRRDRQR